MKKLGILIATVLSLLSLQLIPVLVTAQAQAPTDPNKAAICQGVGFTSGNNDCGPPDQANTSVSNIVQTVINLLSLLVGVVSVVMIIIGGFKYIISSGDSNNVNSAKNTVLYAIIGLVIVALDQVIVRFVLHKATTLPQCTPGQTTNCTPKS